MPIWPFTRSPLKGYRLLRRLLVEARGIRIALERQADVLELAQGASQPREVIGQQVFRSMRRTQRPLSDREVTDLTAVSYADDRVLGEMLRHEEELRALLGREPREDEIERACRGDVE